MVFLAPRLLPDIRPAEGGHALPDAASVLLSLVTLLPGVYGLKELARGEHVATAVVGLVVAVVAGTVFVRRQRRLADPLVDLELFADRRFTVGLGTFLITGVVMAGVSFAAALYLQGVLGLSPTTVGAWMVPQSLVMLAGTLLAPRLDQRFDTVTLVAGGLAVAGGGLMLLGLLDRDALGLHLVAMVVAAAGVSVPMALVINLIMGATPPERAGSAGSLMEMCGELGIALGVATLGTLVAALYRLNLPGLLSSGPVGRGRSYGARGCDRCPRRRRRLARAGRTGRGCCTDRVHRRVQRDRPARRSRAHRHRRGRASRARHTRHARD